MTSRSGERGQATTDYIALLGLLATLLAVVAAVVPGGAPGIVNAVRGQMASALCIVAGTACPVKPPAPCAVAMKRESRRYSLTLALLKLDKDHTVLREQLSDGTIRLTDVRRYGGGVEGGLGARAQIDENLDEDGGLRREARYGAEGVLGLGDVYYAHSPREADRVVQALQDGDEPAVPVRESIIDGGLRGSASLSFGGPSGGLDLDGTAMVTLGLRRNHRTGESTIAFSMGANGSALAAAVVGGPTASLDGSATLALKLDRQHRPIELSLLAVGTLGAGAKLSKALAAPLALSGGDRVPANVVGRRWELGASVDLRDPQVAAAWRRFGGAPTSLAAIRALAQTMRDRAQVDVRTYSADTSSNGTAISLALGLKFGGETDSVIDRFKLLAASSRPPGGLWEPRFDCV